MTAEAQIEQVLDGVRDVLGTDLLGVCLVYRKSIELRSPAHRAIYLGEEEERWDDLSPNVRAHADYVVGEIDRATPPRG